MFPKIGYLGTAGFVPQPERFSSDDLLKSVGANTGNLMFQLACDKVVGGSHMHVGFATRPYDDPEVFRNLDYFVFPAANHLREDADWTHLTSFLKTIKVPLVILGLGAQANVATDLDIVAEAISKNRTVVDFVRVLREKAELITVRGSFSESVCYRLGLNDVLRIGCPSQFLNPNLRLGESIADQLRSNPPGPITTTGIAPNEITGWKNELETKLFGWSSKSGGQYLQQSCESWIFEAPAGRLAKPSIWGLNYLRRRLDAGFEDDKFLENLERSFRIYFSASEWIESLRSQKLAIGTRIHGNMAALAAGKPGIVIAHDARVSELAEEMEIPRVSLDAAAQCDTIDDLLPHVKFDPVSFDTMRRKKAKIFKDRLENIGLPASLHLECLAD